MARGEKILLNNGRSKCWNRLVQRMSDSNDTLPAERFGVLEVKTAQSAHDWRRAKAALGREDGLGAGREAGDRLCQLALPEGKLAAGLVWCAATWHLKGRDETVGWGPVLRSRRLKLVMQLRRFLGLAEGRDPNLASQCPGAGLRALAGQWAGPHGHHRHPRQAIDLPLKAKPDL
jgi:hypothetical protein